MPAAVRHMGQKVSNMSDVTATLPVAGVDLSDARIFTPTEERILTAALGLIGRRGVRRLGMREISEAAGVSRGTLYS